ncbi:hypothetical protein [Paraclostridium bifermentans]|uniref:hypothetical protein n=1 Tax=Paraclostridium bifermentans TaxID=1490 RepID=UPI00374FD270
MHALYNDDSNSELRDFLEPYQIDKELMYRLLGRYKRKLLELRNKELDRVIMWKDENKDRKYPYRVLFFDNQIKVEIGRIENAINKADSCDELIAIKEFLCYSLHIAGYSKYKDISPWVSTSQGENRYYNASKFIRLNNFKKI